MICMNYDHNKTLRLLKFHSVFGKFYLNSPKGFSRKIINAQAEWVELSNKASKYDMCVQGNLNLPRKWQRPCSFLGFQICFFLFQARETVFHVFMQNSCDFIK